MLFSIDIDCDGDTGIFANGESEGESLNSFSSSLLCSSLSSTRNETGNISQYIHPVIFSLQSGFFRIPWMYFLSFSSFCSALSYFCLSTFISRSILLMSFRIPDNASPVFLHNHLLPLCRQLEVHLVELLVLVFVQLLVHFLVLLYICNTSHPL